MTGKTLNKFVQDLLNLAGITINGAQPWDIQIRNEGFFDRVFNQGILGLGESYMDGWWDAHAIDEFICRLLIANLEPQVKQNKQFILYALFRKLFNFQTKRRALEVGRKHYDLGNELFECMLDSRLNYTCGYWKNASSLDEAQLHKMDLVCKKLMLKPGMRLLDIGCGWGSLVKYAAEKYGVQAVGITISEQQCELAKKNCAGLPVEIRFQDYRDINEKFDRIVSLGMFEHVGHHNYRTYFEITENCLENEGLFLLHTIGSNVTCYKTNPWINKYIFPNGMIPSINQIGTNIERLFVMEDWHNFGADYDTTLLAWYNNFNTHWKNKLDQLYDERFRRMWNFYLLMSAGSFRARELQLWQIMLAKKGVKNGYQGVR